MTATLVWKDWNEICFGIYLRQRCPLLGSGGLGSGGDSTIIILYSRVRLGSIYFVITKYDILMEICIVSIII